VIAASPGRFWFAGPHRDELDLASSPPRRTEELSMPNITIQQMPKTVEQKRELAARITDAMVDVYKTPAETVHVWFQEVTTEDYAAAGELVADKLAKK
jgi:4-oxalocrotonate tautomerase